MVYTAPGETIVAEDGQLLTHHHAVLDKPVEHKFIKEVIRHNKVEIFRHLLATRVPLHLSDIYLACQHGHLDMTKIIMNTGVVEVDKATKYGWTPLEIAALNGRTELVKLLVQNFGANPNFSSGQHCPLEYAIEGGHLDTVKEMVSMGARQKERTKKDIFGNAEYKVEYLRSASRLVVQEGELINPGTEYEEIENFLYTEV